MGKRQAPASPKRNPKKAAGVNVPSASALRSLSAGGSASAHVVSEHHIEITILKYCSDGSKYSNLFAAKELYVLQMASSGYPNALFMFPRQVQLYGESQAPGDEDDCVPMNMSDVESMYMAKYQWVGKKTEDVDEVKWAKNRSGFYISGGVENVKEFLMYMDDIVAWRTDYSDDAVEKLPQKPKIVIFVKQQLQLTIDKEKDETKCTFEVRIREEMPMSIFDLPPPVFPARVVIMTFEATSSEVVSVMIGGNTKPFQSGFVELKIQGQSFKEKAEEYGEYYRVIPELQTSDMMKCLETLQEVVGDKCLQSSPVIVREKESGYENASLKDIFADMKCWPNVRLEQ